MNSIKKNTVETIFLNFNNENINYSILHGLDDYPEKLGRDLDILINKKSLNKAIDICKKYLSAYGWEIIEPNKIWGRRIVAFNGDESIELHFLTKIVWRNMLFVSEPLPNIRLYNFKVDKWAYFVKTVLLPLLSEYKIIDLRKNDIIILQNNFSTLLEQDIVTNKIVFKNKGIILDLIENKQQNYNLHKILKLKLLKDTFIHYPFSSLSLSLSLAKRKVLQLCSPCGPIIVILGPDGIGKSTVINELKKKLSNTIFTKVITRHWRPGILPNLRVLTKKDLVVNDSHAPRRIPGKYALLRLLYYLIDYFIGFYLKDRIDSSKQRVIIYDRHYLDMYIDPFRYGIKSNKLMLFVWGIMPKVDAILYLTSDSATIYSRKNELNIVEIEDQLEILDTLYKRKIINYKIENNELNDTVKRIIEIIYNEFNRINS